MYRCIIVILILMHGYIIKISYLLRQDNDYVLHMKRYANKYGKYRI